MNSIDIDDNGRSDNSAKGSWKEWARHVLLELERLNNSFSMLYDKVQKQNNDNELRISTLRQEIQNNITANTASLSKDINNLQIEVAMLKLKSGLWGAMGAAIPILVAIIIYLVNKFVIKE